MELFDLNPSDRGNMQRTRRRVKCVTCRWLLLSGAVVVDAIVTTIYCLV